MKRATRVLIWLPIVLILLIIGLNVYLFTFNLDAHRGRLETLLGETLGRQIELRGAMQFEPSLVPTASIQDVVIGNPSWASRPEFATTDRITLQLALMPLLKDRIEIAGIGLDGADILLERGPEGQNNWTFGRKHHSGNGNWRFAGLDELTLEAVDLGYRDAEGHTRRTRIESASATWPSGSPLNLKTSLRLNGREYTLSATAGTIEELLSKQPGDFPIHVDVVTGGAHFTAGGTLTVPPNGEFSMELALSAAELQALGTIGDPPVPANGPVRVSARVSRTGGLYRISGMRTELPGWNDFPAVKIEHGHAVLGPGAPTRFSASGHLGNEKFTADLTGAPFSGLSAEQGKWPVDIEVSLARSTLKASGALTLPIREPGGAFDVQLRVHDGTGMSRLFSGRFSGYLPANLTGRLEASRNAASLRSARFDSPGGSVKGDLHWKRGNGTRRIDANLEAGRIDLTPYLESAGVGGPSASGTSGLDAPVEAGFLRDWNAGVSLDIERLEGLRLPLSRLSLRGTVSEGNIEVASLRGTIPGGRIEVEGNVDFNGAEPAVSATARSSEFDLGGLLEALGHGKTVAGTFGNPRIALDGSGSTLREVLTGSRIEARTAALTLSIGKGDHPRPIELKAHRFQAISQRSKPVSVSLEGTLNGVTIGTKGTVGTMSNWLRSGATRELSVDARASGARLRFQGDLVLPWTGHFGATYTLSGQRLSALDSMIPGTLPDLRDFVIGGALLLDDDTLRLTELSVRAENLDARANLNVSGQGGRRAISGSVTVANLDLTALPGRYGESRHVPLVAPEFVPDAELPVEALRSTDLDLDIRLTDLKWRTDSIGFFSLKAVLKEGDLLVDPVQGDLSGGGDLKGRLEYRASLRTPSARIDISVNDFNYGRWINGGNLSAEARGLADFHLDLQGRGRTTKQLLASSSGVETVVAGPTRLLDVDQLRVTVNIHNLINLMLPDLVKNLEGKRKKAGIICFASRWEVENGLARSDDIVLDGLHTMVAASGAINLATEKIDMLVYPRDKGFGLIDIAIPVRVTGTVKAPHFEVAEVPRVSALGFLNLSLANPTHLVETLENLPSVFTGGRKAEEVGTNRCTEAIASSDHGDRAGEETQPRGVRGRIRGLLHRIEGNGTGNAN